MKTITITKTMSLPVEETITLPAFFKGKHESYLIILAEKTAMYIDAYVGWNKVEIISYPEVYITNMSMTECDKDEALRAFNQVSDNFYEFFNQLAK